MRNALPQGRIIMMNTKFLLHLFSLFVFAVVGFAGERSNFNGKPMSSLFCLDAGRGVEMNSQYILSISVENERFSRSRRPELSALIENRSTESINVGGVIFKLSRHGKEIEARHTGQVFSSSFRPKNCSSLAPGDACRFNVRLDELYWEDLFSNPTNFEMPKNLFDTITAGRYYLFMELSFPGQNSIATDPRTKTLQSNDLAVTVER
jgi:hypothetical protein